MNQRDPHEWNFCWSIECFVVRVFCIIARVTSNERLDWVDEISLKAFVPSLTVPPPCSPFPHDAPIDAESETKRKISTKPKIESKQRAPKPCNISQLGTAQQIHSKSTGKERRGGRRERRRTTHEVDDKREVTSTQIYSNPFSLHVSWYCWRASNPRPETKPLDLNLKACLSKMIWQWLLRRSFSQPPPLLSLCEDRCVPMRENPRLNGWNPFSAFLS